MVVFSVETQTKRNQTDESNFTRFFFFFFFFFFKFILMSVFIRHVADAMIVRHLF